MLIVNSCKGPFSHAPLPLYIQATGQSPSRIPVKATTNVELWPSTRRLGALTLVGKPSCQEHMKTWYLDIFLFGPMPYNQGRGSISKAFASAMCIFIKPFYFPDINLWVTYIYSYVIFKWRSMAVIYLYLRPETCVNTINVTPWWRTRLAVLTRSLSLIVGLGGHLRVYWGQLIMLLGPSLQSVW